jgi:hypothetical protein
MGPNCRARLLTSVEVDETARKEANKLVYQIAAVQKGVDILEPLERLRELGFVKLADRIEKRCKMKPEITIREMGEELYIWAPYDYEASKAWRNIPGRKWRQLPGQGFEGKVNTVPKSQKRAAWALLLTYFKGKLATGPKGLFIVKEV